MCEKLLANTVIENYALSSRRPQHYQAKAQLKRSLRAPLSVPRTLGFRGIGRVTA